MSISSFLTRKAESVSKKKVVRKRHEKSYSHVGYGTQSVNDDQSSDALSHFDSSGVILLVSLVT